MENSKKESGKVEGQDFAKPEDDKNKASSHGEVANQQGGDFSELEESRMDNPPKKRDTNGSEKSGSDAHTHRPNQESGIGKDS